jgi:hypothetical protein
MARYSSRYAREEEEERKARKRAKAKKAQVAQIDREEGHRHLLDLRQRTGGTCGVHHGSYLAAIAHRKKLDLVSFRAGRGRPWNVEKR